MQVFHDRAQQIANDAQIFILASQRIKELEGFINDLKEHFFYLSVPHEMSDLEGDALEYACTRNDLQLSDKAQLCYRDGAIGAKHLLITKQDWADALAAMVRHYEARGNQ